MSRLPRHGRTRRAQEGYILAATIWFVAAMAISIGYYAVWMDRETARWQEALDDARLDAAMQGRLATLQYLVLTRPPEAGGIPDLDGELLRVDGRGYVDEAGVGFAILDLAGLLPINSNDGTAILRLLGLAGVPAARAAGLVARLLDYVDNDMALRPNGLEFDRENRTSVPNRTLSYPAEFRQVAGWEELLTPEQLRFIEDHTSIYAPIATNLNAAPEAVLRTLAAVSEDAAARIVEARQLAPFLSFPQLLQAAGLPRSTPIDGMTATLYPTRFLRLSVWKPGSTVEFQLNLRLTSVSQGRVPWLIDYAGWARQPAWRRMAEEQE